MCRRSQQCRLRLLLRTLATTFVTRAPTSSPSKHPTFRHHPTSFPPLLTELPLNFPLFFCYIRFIPGAFPLPGKDFPRNRRLQRTLTGRRVGRTSSTVQDRAHSFVSNRPLDALCGRGLIPRSQAPASPRRGLANFPAFLPPGLCEHLSPRQRSSSLLSLTNFLQTDSLSLKDMVSKSVLFPPLAKPRPVNFSRPEEIPLSSLELLQGTKSVSSSAIFPRFLGLCRNRPVQVFFCGAVSFELEKHLLAPFFFLSPFSISFSRETASSTAASSVKAFRSGCQIFLFFFSPFFFLFSQRRGTRRFPPWLF